MENIENFCTIGFNKDNNNFIIGNILNTYYYYLKYKFLNLNILDLSTYTFLNDNPELNYIIDNNKLYVCYDDLYNEFLNIEKTLEIDFNNIIHIFITLFKLFNIKNKCIDKKFIDKPYYYISPLNIDFNKKMYCRTGVVELRIINMYYYGNKTLIKDALFFIINNHKLPNFMYESDLSCWITMHHDLKNYISYIKNLMTNAGFYIDFNGNLDEAYNCLQVFCESYYDSIINSDVRPYWAFLDCFSLNILNAKKKIKKELIIQTYYLDNNIHSLLSNKYILFITAYKENVDNIYNSGKIYNLRKDKNFENIFLVTIESFLTTYPNTKHKDFIETLQYYFNEIDNSFIQYKFDIFICSCGCYGLSLCNYVYNKYNITSIYNGHSINEHFGILTNRSSLNENIFNIEKFEKANINNKYKNLEKIENNSYGTN